jgi:hypothetical protein
MQNQLNRPYYSALKLLRQLTTSKGILASSLESDNYKRIWARDSIISGIAGILSEDTIVIEGLKTSLLTLAKYQNIAGAIPSNVFEKDETADVSYGSLVGRVDTNTWFIIGASLYYINTKDTNTWKILKPIIQKCRSYLKSIEFNDKGWIYTPLSGNWADEYPIHGYTLYDNSLRLWGETLWLKINKEDTSKIDDIKFKTKINFWPIKDYDGNNIYQKSSYKKASSKTISHFCSFILPGVYDTRFDAAGNAIALLNFKLSALQKTTLSKFIKTLNTVITKRLIPAFWPVIQKGDSDWQHIEGNYSFDFKNKPFHFHNGGIWPVWMGLFCLGLAHNNMNEEVAKIVSEFEKIMQQPDWNFQEYITSDDFQLKGKTQMGFTASGIVFMYHALKDKFFNLKLGL